MAFKIDDICIDWGQKEYGAKYNVRVDTSGLKVFEGKINYREKDSKKNKSFRHTTKTYINRLNIQVEQEFSDQSTKRYTCVWTKTKGVQVSGSLSVNVGLPKTVGVSAKLGGQYSLSKQETTTSGTDETLGQVTKLPQPPRSTLLAEITTTERVTTMPYTLNFRLQGNISFTLQNKKKGTEKVKNVDVCRLHKALGGRVVTDAGEKSVQLTIKGTFKSTTETSQVVEMKEPDPDTTMKMIHNDLLRDNCEKLVEEVKDKPALSKLLKVMSSEQVISEEQLNTVDQKASVQEGVDNIVHVLENVEPAKFLIFVDILRKEGYKELVELLDCRSIYPDNVRQISNLSGVVDHYFVTKKESEVKNSLESPRRVIIHGMPGSGKTQLAMKVASDYARIHPHAVVWAMDGSSQDKLDAEILELQQRISGEANVERSIFESLVSRWKYSLLFINDLSPTVEIPQQLLRSSAKIIVTTQDSLLALEDVRNILLDGFIEDEAVAFLSPQMPTETPAEQVRELANIFSCLPLGLAAARASIHRGNMTVEEYKRQLQGERAALEALMAREDRWLQKHYKKEHQEAAKNIFAALQLAVDKLDDPSNPEEEKKFKVMLQHCAFLEPDNIPILILKAALKSRPVIGSEAELTERMKMFSLGSIDGEGVKRRLSIHGVTQRALRLQIDKEQQTTTCINKLLQVLVKFFFKNTTYSNTHKLSPALMPHVDAVLKHADKLELGPEYPLVKARLLMVYGHLLIQKGTPALSEEPLKEAKKLLLQFTDIPLDFSSAQRQSVENDPGSDTISTNLYNALVDKSQSLPDTFIQETVVSRVITKQQLRAVSDKLDAGNRETLTNMVENVEPLNMELYSKLVDKNLAIPIEILKKTFLPELYASIIYPLGIIHSDQEAIIREMCEKVRIETGFITLVHFLITTDRWSLWKGMVMIKQMLGFQPEDKYSRDDLLLMDFIVDAAITKGMMAEHATVYEFGIATSLDGVILTKLNCYEHATKFCTDVLMSAVPMDAEEGNEFDPISTGQQACLKMLNLVGSEDEAGNPLLKQTAYYIVAGKFMFETAEHEVAAFLFKTAYGVELKREEYHPRMGEALMGLIHVRIAQKELRRARVCARRLLQLIQDHWPEKVAEAEEVLTKVRSMIVVRAFKQNKEVQKSKLRKVTTV